MRAAANPSQLKPGMRAIDAFVALAGPDLLAIDECLDALNRRDHPEDVHALRVAVRHLRALCWTFKPALPPAVARRWGDCLRALAHAASAVRDWDVFVMETLQPALDYEPDEPMLLGLLDSAATRRHFARESMLARLAEIRHWPLPVLRRDLGHLAAGAGRHGAAAARRRLKAFARQRVRRGRERVRELARQVEAENGQDVASVHRWRIGGKRLRYAIEALAPVLPARYAKRLRRKLVKRQGDLGSVVDAAVARRLMGECLAMMEKSAAQDSDGAAPGQHGAPRPEDVQVMRPARRAARRPAPKRRAAAAKPD
ncbi:CHAD domain-containing protein [Cupriavidus sp. 30B13]|uniref:CHAD domain-containing protein n=1 Tax=Cupriavidus sp. 30B13 TaxID=3384241 RepID=UPI003B8ED572